MTTPGYSLRVTQGWGARQVSGPAEKEVAEVIRPVQVADNGRTQSYK